MDKSMDSRTTMHQVSHQMGRSQETFNPPRHNNLRNEDWTQTRAKSGVMWILLQEREQRSQGRVMNVGERRYLCFTSPGRALFNFHRLITDISRYDAMLSRRPLGYSAVLANEQTRCAISEERHKSEVQAKGEWIPRNA